MGIEQAKEILGILYSFYPNFNKRDDDEFDKIWIKRLLEGDYEKTLYKTKNYTENSKYPPSLADVFVPIHKPINTELTDIQAAEAAVRREKADPEVNARREAALRRMGEKLKELKRIGK